MGNYRLYATVHEMVGGRPAPIGAMVPSCWETLCNSFR
jgi:hypothetical protein